jgi:hypothetical protein
MRPRTLFVSLGSVFGLVVVLVLLWFAVANLRGTVNPWEWWNQTAADEAGVPR